MSDLYRRFARAEACPARSRRTDPHRTTASAGRMWSGPAPAHSKRPRASREIVQRARVVVRSPTSGDTCRYAFGDGGDGDPTDATKMQRQDGGGVQVSACASVRSRRKRRTLHDSSARGCIRALSRNTAFVKERLRTIECFCQSRDGWSALHIRTSMSVRCTPAAIGCVANERVAAAISASIARRRWLFTGCRM